MQGATNFPRIMVTVILAVVIGVLIYIMATHDMRPPQDANIGIKSPVSTEQLAPGPRGNVFDSYDTFNDGLIRPSSEVNNAPDDFGVGVTSVRVYNHDLNNDGVLDRITRTHIENGTSHFTNEYKIELATGNGYVNITPDNFYTSEGADCALRKLYFDFDPVFTVTVIGREMGDNYYDPTMAYRSVYQLANNHLMQISHEPVGMVCDVSELFH